jgi:hypothetical protein
MAMLELWSGECQVGEDMARSKSRQLNTDRIAMTVSQLKMSLHDAAVFQSWVEKIEADKTLSAAEIIEIAKLFVGGVRATSRTAALSSIVRRRIEMSHARAKSNLAAKTRLW